MRVSYSKLFTYFTVVDAGSVGWKHFEELKEEIIDRSITRVLAFLNIAGGGMLGDKKAEQNVGDMDPESVAEMIEKYPDILVGVKSAHFGGPGWESADRAVVSRAVYTYLGCNFVFLEARRTRQAQTSRAK